MTADVLNAYPSNTAARFARLCLAVMAVCSIPIQVLPLTPPHPTRPHPTLPDPTPPRPTPPHPT